MKTMKDYHDLHIKCDVLLLADVFKRYSETNNKYLHSPDPKQESKHVIHLDNNKSYGYAMSKYLPTVLKF